MWWFCLTIEKETISTLRAYFLFEGKLFSLLCLKYIFYFWIRLLRFIERDLPFTICYICSMFLEVPPQLTVLTDWIKSINLVTAVWKKPITITECSKVGLCTKDRGGKWNRKGWVWQGEYGGYHVIHSLWVAIMQIWAGMEPGQLGTVAVCAYITNKRPQSKGRRRGSLSSEWAAAELGGEGTANECTVI